MNCAVCGKDNQPGTRFCVHCGAALAAPRPASPTGPASAGTATVARPAQSLGPDTVTRAAAASAPDAAGASGVPAYDAAPPGSGGKVLLAIGVAALVLAAGFVGYKIFGGSAEVKDSFAKFEVPAPPRDATPPPSARPAEPSPPPPEPAKVEDKSAAAPVDASKAEVPKSEAPKTEASKADAPKSDASKAQAEQDKAKGTLPKTDTKASVKAPGGAATAVPGATPSASASASAARAAPSPVPAQVAPPAAAPVQDRWAQMAAEQRECQKENVFARVICAEKVRLRYCKDYWGTLPQCPGALVNPDKGQ